MVLLLISNLIWEDNLFWHVIHPTLHNFQNILLRSALLAISFLLFLLHSEDLLNVWSYDHAGDLTNDWNKLWTRDLQTGPKAKCSTWSGSFYIFTVSFTFLKVKKKKGKGKKKSLVEGEKNWERHIYDLRTKLFIILSFTKKVCWSLL